MIWITKSDNTLIELANAWLIQTFVDYQAEIIFSSPNDIDDKINETLAIPFGIDGVEFADSLDQSTFEKILISYRFDNPALILMSQVLKELNLNPQDQTLKEFKLDNLKLPALNDNITLETAQNFFGHLYEECKKISFPKLKDESLH